MKIKTNKKNIVIIITTILLVATLTAISIQTFAEVNTYVANGTCGENFTWTLDNEGTLTISGIGEMADYNYSNTAPWKSYKNKINKVIISDGITSIGICSFYECTNITNIIISNSVTKIRGSAFYGCTNLTNITLPHSIKEIAGYVFNCCVNLEYISIPDGVTSIGEYTFNNCIRLKSITIPDSVKSIGKYAFYGCENLTNITFGDDSQLSSIEDYVFYGCKSLTNISIPDSVKSIGKYAFYGCKSLTSITFGNNSQLSSIGDYAFYGCKRLTSITIPDSVVSVGYSAFLDCSDLEECTYNGSIVKWCNIDFMEASSNPCSNVNCDLFINGKKLDKLTDSDLEDVSSISKYAFYGCSSLTSITIPNSVTSIGYDAFYNCTSLTSITIPNSVTSIGNSAFGYCTSLTSITIPDSVTSINSAFFYCTSLTSITIPDSVISIGGSAFYGCIGLTNITIPNSVTSIGDYAFGYCESLTSITIPEGVTSIGDYAFGYCESFTSITIPEGVTSIGSSAFYGCTGLTNITIPEGVTSIGSSAFYGCTGLTNITIPEGVTSIGSYAFYGCIGLTNITIPNSVTSINSCAFWFCRSLEEIIIPNSVKEIGQFAFSSCRSLVSVNFEKNSQLTRIVSNAFYGCVSLTNIVIPESVTSIAVDAFENCLSLSSIIVEEKNKTFDSRDNCNAVVETSANRLVLGCKNTTIPNSITSIGDKAFIGCRTLESIIISDSVITIGNFAFENCTSLTSILIPESVTSIGKYVFIGCNKLENITIPNSVTSINAVFYGCTGLTNITIPDSVISIGESAFYNCTSLTNITIPDSVTSIGKSAFYNCTSLESIIIPEEVTSIGLGAFYNCTNLVSITIPESVTSIGYDAFYNLCNVNYGGYAAGTPWGAKYANGYVKEYRNGSGKYTLVYRDKTETELCACCTYASGKIKLPTSVEKISGKAFYMCSEITEIEIDITNGEPEIPSYTFYGCTKLEKISYISKEVIATQNVIFGDYGKRLIFCSREYKGESGDGVYTIPTGVTDIDDYAFAGCRGFKEVIIPDSVVNIGANAFANTTMYTTAKENAVVNGNYKFICVGNCLIKAEYVGSEEDKNFSCVIPEGVTCIAAEAFADITNLTSVTIPSSVKGIGKNAFEGCTSLETITANCNNLEYIGENAFSDTKWYSKSGSDTLYIGSALIKVKNTARGNVEIKENTTCIADEAFKGNESITSITIPDTVVRIGTSAFEGCTNLASVTIGAGVTSIGDSAFANCSNLSEITLPSGLDFLGSGVFTGCKSLEKIKVSSNSGYFTDDGVLYSIKNEETILEAYPIAKDNVDFTVPSNVSKIANYAFAYAANLKDVYLNKETKYNTLAFWQCDARRNSVNVKDGYQLSLNGKTLSQVTEKAIDNNGCFKVPDGVIFIQSNAFTGEAKEKLKSIDLNGAKYIYDGVFSDCKNLSKIDGLNSVYYVGKEAFKNCISLTEVDLSSVEYVGASAFAGCSNLKANNVKVAESAKIITGAFIDGAIQSRQIKIEQTIGKNNTVILKANTKVPGEVVWISKESDTEIGTGDSITINAKANYSIMACVVCDDEVVAETEYEIVAEPDNFEIEGAKVKTGIQLGINKDYSEIIGQYFEIEWLDEKGNSLGKGTTSDSFTPSSNSFTVTLKLTSKITGKEYSRKIDVKLTDNGNVNIENKVAIKSFAGSKDVGYKEKVRITASANAMPAGSTLVLYDGNKVVVSKKADSNGNASIEYVSDNLTQSKTYTVKIIDSTGKVIKDNNGNSVENVIKVNVKAGFFQKLIAFFKSLFGLIKVIDIKP